MVLLTLFTICAAAQQPFTISSSYQNLLSNAYGSGILDRVFTEALRRIGMPAETVYTATERSLVDELASALQEVKADGTYDRIVDDVLESYGITVE